MNSIIEKQRETHIINECDVLVAGGGIAGIAAALAAARAGAKVILLEKEFALGGLATLGLVTIYLPLCDGRGNQVSFGISEELLKLSVKYGAEADYPKAWLDNGTLQEKIDHRYLVRYNPHIFAILAEQLLRQEGVQILYGSSVCGVDMVNRKINCVIIENKTGRSAIKVQSVVDATGDADICKQANAEVAVFKQKNLLAGWYYYTNNGDLELRTLGPADVPEEYKDETNTPKPLVDRRFVGLDGTELSEMVQMSHDFILKDILEHREADKSHIPVTIPSIPQIRMTRRIVGRFTLDDKESHQAFDDSIGLISDWRKRGPVYEVPFRTLYGGDVDNLITAGRCISVTDSMWDISRVIPACAVTGEAAGVAAAMTDDFKGLDVVKLQKNLESKGVKLKCSQI